MVEKVDASSRAVVSMAFTSSRVSTRSRGRDGRGDNPYQAGGIIMSLMPGLM
jgi:hypothetical protein